MQANEEGVGAGRGPDRRWNENPVPGRVHLDALERAGDGVDEDDAVALREGEAAAGQGAG